MADSATGMDRMTDAAADAAFAAAAGNFSRATDISRGRAAEIFPRFRNCRPGRCRNDQREKIADGVACYNSRHRWRFVQTPASRPGLLRLSW